MAGQVRSRKHWLMPLVLAATVTVSAAGVDDAEAKGKRKKAARNYNPPYAAILVDVNSGQVMHHANADSLRHPASLTKIMTLYLLFEQIEAGKLKLDSQLEVSAHAAAQAPSKLGIKPGQTLAVEDAIRALITKSANDAAVIVAEAIGGSEAEFARRMTAKARALGMTRTVYRNASGLPDEAQVTTAREQALLGRAIQDRFPRYYRYFATASFQYRGIAFRNHNKLLGRVAGVDGIKTGYTNASGFNLVSSMRRGNRHVIAVVLGGRSGNQRDARMRSLLEQHIVAASAHRSAPRIMEAAADSRPTPRTRTAENAPMAMALAGSPPAEVDSTRIETPPTGSIRVGTGALDPIQPLAVKTVTVRAGANHSAAINQLTAGMPSAASAYSSQDSALLPAGLPPPPGAAPGVLGVLPGSSLQQMQSGQPAAGPPLAEQGSAAASTPPGAHRDMRLAKVEAQPGRLRGDWAIQVGAFPNEEQAKGRLKSAQSIAKALLVKAAPLTERVKKGDHNFYRARFTGLDRDTAEAACKLFKRNEIACVTLKN